MQARNAAATLALLTLISVSGVTQIASFPFQDPSLPAERRVDDLVSRMTLEEKTSQMVNASAAIPRLGVPTYDWWNEGLHGVARSGYATMFPQAIGMAATLGRAAAGTDRDRHLDRGPGQE